ncbi:MAG TPA: hypothetical protein VEB43_18000 [Anaeromyxobacter sp.]|nr:hypothetical protein [Anaeromyxobacter sp.]
MSVHGAAVRALGVATVAYAAALASMPIQLVRASSAMGQVTSGIANADPAAREAMARVYQIELLGHRWEVGERVFRFWVHATFSAVTLAVLAGWFVAARSERGRA